MYPRKIRSTITPSVMPTQPESFRKAQIRYQDQLMYHLEAWLQTYADYTSGLEMRADTTVKPDDGSEMQVDALLRVQEYAGGQSRVEGDYVAGSPEMIIETFNGISPSKVHRRQVKHSEKGITESIVVDSEGTAPWYCPGDYTLHSGENILSGTTFPGLKLNIEYFYDGDLSAQLLQLRSQLGSGIHRWYEERLEADG